jgi:hypothetical protein
VLININSACKQDFTDVLIVGMIAGNFDFFRRKLLAFRRRD